MVKNKVMQFFMENFHLPERGQNSDIGEGGIKNGQKFQRLLWTAPYPEIRVLSTDVWMPLTKQELVVTIPYFHYSSPSKQDFA